MAEKTGFPRHLLDQPPDARLAHFVSFKAKHPMLMGTYEELRCSIRDAIPGSLIFVCGPTGAGKTTLLEGIFKNLQEEALGSLETRRDRIPVVRIQAIAPLTGNFDWKDYFRRLLIELEEPVVRGRIDVGRWEEAHRNNMQLIASPKAVGAHLLHAAEQTLHYREPTVLVDDAQHFAVIGSGRKLLDHLNIVKSVADVTKRTHVLFGTYELLPFRNLNGQLSRRSVDIHFRRYRADDESQRQAFINVLWTFQRQLPLPETPDLVSYWDFFYERSIGCVGVLKDWLTRAYALALEDSAKTLERSHVERRALSVSQCVKMLTEAVQGEKELADDRHAHLKLRASLGLELGGQEAPGINDTRVGDEMSPKSARRRRGRRPGQRNAVRDEIGVKHDGHEQPPPDDSANVVSILPRLGS
jgi:hypothetical protein